PSSSRTRNTAAATEMAATKSAATTVALRGAYKPKLAKVTDNQKITTARNSVGTEPLPAPRMRQRVRTTSPLNFSASSLNQRWVSVFGESARIWFSTSSMGGALSDT